MGKVKQSASARLRNYVSEFGSEILSTDGFVLFCKVCESKINFEKKFNVSQQIYFNFIFLCDTNCNKWLSY